MRAAPRLDDEDEKNEKDGKKDSSYLLEKNLFDARTIIVSGPIDDKLCTATVAKLLSLEDKDPEAAITIFVNSPGGSADAGFAMYDMIRFVKCPVRCVVNGLCASAAVLVFLAAPKGQRFSLPSSRFLLHQPSTGAQGTASDLEITAQQIVKMRERYNQIVADAADCPAEKVLEDVNRDFWLDASEAKQYGIVDRVLNDRSEID
ncbi:MAG: ATP-dependent Clp protease proteolytic subunit [Planctomycetota bacterium]|nr:MAG: ATP-dependent Clp protease proteolytic subunit [Planctomycetota bacterium]